MQHILQKFQNVFFSHKKCVKCSFFVQTTFFLYYSNSTVKQILPSIIYNRNNVLFAFIVFYFSHVFPCYNNEKLRGKCVTFSNIFTMQNIFCHSSVQILSCSFILVWERYISEFSRDVWFGLSKLLLNCVRLGSLYFFTFFKAHKDLTMCDRNKHSWVDLLREPKSRIFSAQQSRAEQKQVLFIDCFFLLFIDLLLFLLRDMIMGRDTPYREKD